MPKLVIANALKKHPLYSSFIQVKNKLEGLGFVCWIAGGAVRDFLIGRMPYDLDLVTDATTEQILLHFSNAIPVGIQFGVVKIPVENGMHFDLATFRRESDYVDGRRPSHVDYATAAEDALRRDFTMNALFWNDQQQRLEDYVHGYDDLIQKSIRCVGDPNVRFTEDHLRILRLLRFKYQLGFQIDPATLAAALPRVSLLSKMSGERIWLEFQKMLPFVNWDQFRSDPLAQGIFKEIFTVELKCECLPPLGSNGFVALIVVLMESTSDLPAIKAVLQKRLKVSRDELKNIDLVVSLLNSPLSEPEWAFEIEKNTEILALMQDMVFMNRFDQSKFHKIKSVYENRPIKCVDGNDLLGRIEPKQITEALKQIRLRQLVQPDLKKEELLKPYFSIK